MGLRTLCTTYRRKRRLAITKAGYLLQQLGYTQYLRDRLAAPWIWDVGGLVGFDLVDPELYEALVAAELTGAAPGAVSVRSLRYRTRLARRSSPLAVRLRGRSRPHLA